MSALKELAAALRDIKGINRADGQAFTPTSVHTPEPTRRQRRRAERYRLLDRLRGATRRAEKWKTAVLALREKVQTLRKLNGDMAKLTAVANARAGDVLAEKTRQLLPKMSELREQADAAKLQVAEYRGHMKRMQREIRLLERENQRLRNRLRVRNKCLASEAWEETRAALRKFLCQADVPIRVLAAEFGVSEAAVSLWLRGQKCPRAGVQERLAAWLRDQKAASVDPPPAAPDPWEATRLDLKALLLERHQGGVISAHVLARDTGVHHAAVLKWLSGAARPRPELQSVIADWVKRNAAAVPRLEDERRRDEWTVTRQELETLLHKFRKPGVISLRVLAADVGVDPSVAQEWLYGQCRPRPERQERVAAWVESKKAELKKGAGHVRADP